ncbi:PepSY domain-containing protein [Vogesella sp. LIG4]|uniref:PepSY domain-containing protein n=1 Tax=Vogesella sp. LIG4 TaxID=1192162 RepID=UPI00081FF0A3|nr:PepSY domain-containing protein [Vogesella sp. LIG4]SCK15783.1 hypothetical protein PSELUDRAFT_1576 [Vogesella sp. LIG4]
MNRLFVAVLLAASAASVFAAARCPAQPKGKWQPEAEFRKQLASQGYRISRFRISGNCYEVEGRNRDNKQVEIDFDPVSGKPVRSDIED